MAVDSEPVTILSGQCERGDHHVCPRHFKAVVLVLAGVASRTRPAVCRCWCHREAEVA